MQVLHYLWIFCSNAIVITSEHQEMVFGIWYLISCNVTKVFNASWPLIIDQTISESLQVLSGHRHATISLICMSTHKAMAARCLSDHQAAYGQPAIRALATATLRRLALNVLFTIMTNSYPTTCTVSERTFNKRQHANARQGVDLSTTPHYDMVAAQT